MKKVKRIVFIKGFGGFTKDGCALVMTDDGVWHRTSEVNERNYIIAGGNVYIETKNTIYRTAC